MAWKADGPLSAPGNIPLINTPQHFHKTGATRPLVPTEAMQRRHLALLPFVLESRRHEEKKGYGGKVEKLCNSCVTSCGHCYRLKNYEEHRCKHLIS